jgi:malonate-semialdehyde dehydrogenase (acetylating) / methylmalonate-semialdehyde dehydrogenase
MAASVVLLIQEQKVLLNKLVQKASEFVPGNESGQMGPIFDTNSLNTIVNYITNAENDTTNSSIILLDGRSWINQMKHTNGNWIGPTIILHKNCTNECMINEIFGPVLSIYICNTWYEAIQIENNKCIW